LEGELLDTVTESFHIKIGSRFKVTRPFLAEKTLLLYSFNDSKKIIFASTVVAYSILSSQNYEAFMQTPGGNQSDLI
jgi:hypothetical protein